ncbi:hypothetical protein SR42_00380 [Clostridium botulinum]|nr:hypothetical protein SR42_00380 [Clostridium botulinum]
MLDCISTFLGKGYVDGVATKYISNYIKWFKWLQIFNTDKEIIKAKNFIVQSNVAHSYIKIKD